MQFRSLGREDPVEKEMTSHSSILAWEIPMDGGAWQATVHGVAKSQTRVSPLSTRKKATLRWKTRDASRNEER